MMGVLSAHEMSSVGNYGQWWTMSKIIITKDLLHALEGSLESVIRIIIKFNIYET
jgi:hypothetical protein